jgi:hypothetical protein
MDTQVAFADGVDDRVGLVLNLGADDLVIGGRRDRCHQMMMVRGLPVGGNGFRRVRTQRTPRRSRPAEVRNDARMRLRRNDS